MILACTDNFVQFTIVYGISLFCQLDKPLIFCIKKACSLNRYDRVAPFNHTMSLKYAGRMKTCQEAPL